MIVNHIGVRLFIYKNSHGKQLAPAVSVNFYPFGIYALATLFRVARQMPIG
jgi:hypothetical protein